MKKKAITTEVVYKFNVFALLILLVPFLFSCEKEEVRKDIPRSGLVAFYPFNGNANDESRVAPVAHGNVRDAFLTNDRYGNKGKAFDFYKEEDWGTGISRNIIIDNVSKMQIEDAITIAAWFYLERENNFLTGSLVSKEDIYTHNLDQNAGYGFSIGGGYLSFNINRYLLNTPESKDQVYHPNIWTFVAVTYDGNKLTFYKDDTYSSSVMVNDYGPFNPSKVNPVIGKLNGKIDDVAIYNRVLSQDEIKQLYEQTITK